LPRALVHDERASAVVEADLVEVLDGAIQRDAGAREIQSFEKLGTSAARTVAAALATSTSAVPADFAQRRHAIGHPHGL
jgi:hypothetical protein